MNEGSENKNRIKLGVNLYENKTNKNCRLKSSRQNFKFQGKNLLMHFYWGCLSSKGTGMLW